MNKIVMPIKRRTVKSKTLKHEVDSFDFKEIEEGKEIPEKKSRWKRLFR